MNRLVIIGNGFDLAHGLKTSYKDFIRWYLKEFFKEYFENHKAYQEDKLLKFEREIRYDPQTGLIPFDTNEYSAYSLNDKEKEPWTFLDEIKNINLSKIKVDECILLKRILKNIDKDWHGIESDYYALLKENADNIETCKSLNNQMDFLRDKLAEYLNEQKIEADIVGVKFIIDSNVKIDDVAIRTNKISHVIFKNQQDNGYEVERTMLLDFNYTSTSDKYKISDKITVNHIHGSLSNPKQMIFGYGDEMDKDFQELEDRNDNELLKNIKSIKYLEDNSYRQLLQFIEGAPFQVFIMGHSCGNSDRTLLNTIFEHENCISIKPFYYVKGKGEDDYSDISTNIYRNFKNKVLYRDRVMKKPQCEPMPQIPKATK
ncbi:MAG: AbiH family protein [Paludibacteraceae bacterium]|nr:AbiH family protein [Paludibacteraceae bacterium]